MTYGHVARLLQVFVENEINLSPDQSCMNCAEAAMTPARAVATSRRRSSVASRPLAREGSTNATPSSPKVYNLCGDQKQQLRPLLPKVIPILIYKP